MVPSSTPDLSMLRLIIHDLPISPKPIPLDCSPLWDNIFGKVDPHIDHPETLPICDNALYVSIYMRIRVYIYGSIDPLLLYEKIKPILLGGYMHFRYHSTELVI